MKKISIVMLIISSFSPGFAQTCVQDTADHGQMDQVFINCTPPDQFVADSAVVSFDLMFTTDNAGGTQGIEAWYMALLITSTCSARVVIDTTPGGAVYGGTASGSPNDWEARFNSSDPPSGITPATVVYGALQDLMPPANAGPSLAAGTHILAHVVVVVYDTCCIIIDTTSTETVSLAVFRNDAVGYPPCWQGPYQCCVAPCKPGDFAGGGSLNLNDITRLLNYLFKCGPPPTCLPNEANGNCELDFGDLIYLISDVFGAGPAPVPYCSNPDTYSDPGQPDTIKIGTVTGCPGDTVAVPVYVNNDEAIYPVIPLRIDTSKVKCDSIITAGTRGAGKIGGRPVYCGDSTGVHLNSSSNGLDNNILTAGNGVVAYLRCIIRDGDSGLVKIDSATLGPNLLRFFKGDTYSIKPVFISGGINIACPVNFKVTLRAFSPVNLVVIEPTPEADSIGLDTTATRPDTIFNTILEGSSYDTTQDANEDGENDVIITIPFPYDGPYQIRVVPTDTGQFSLDYQAGNNLRVVLADSVVITTTDTNFTYGLVVLPYLRGDANSDGARNLVDIIRLKNYVFGGGPAPDPLALGDVNCGGIPVVGLADIVYMVNYVFKFGPPPCS